MPWRLTQPRVSPRPTVSCMWKLLTWDLDLRAQPPPKVSARFWDEEFWGTEVKAKWWWTNVNHTLVIVSHESNKGFTIFVESDQYCSFVEAKVYFQCIQSKIFPHMCWSFLGRICRWSRISFLEHGTTLCTVLGTRWDVYVQVRGPATSAARPRFHMTRGGACRRGNWKKLWDVPKRVGSWRLPSRCHGMGCWICRQPDMGCIYIYICVQ